MRSVARAKVRVLAAVLVVAAVALGVGASSLRSWRDGPVGGLLTDGEYRQFGTLRNDLERREFIDRFWRELGGGAGPAGGDYRETFERRCALADARYRSGGTEGWRTDRGRIVVALGEPSSVRRELGGVNATEREIWTYGAGGDPGQVVTFAFYRCVDGGYRLDPGCSFDRDPTSVAYDGERADYLRRVRDSNPAIASGRLLAMLAGMLDPIPGGVPLFGGAPVAAADARSTRMSSAPGPASAVAAPQVHGLDNASYFFRAQDGTVLTILALELAGARREAGPETGGAGPGYVAAASVEETDRRGGELPGTSARTVALDAATPAGEGGRAVFFGRVYLQPGKTYAVRYAVKDPAHDEVLVRNAVVGVPELTHGFSASSVVPAERFGPAGAAPSAFQVGSEEVVPKEGGSFRRSELLRLYLQVYDAAIDAKSARSRVDVVFRFYRVVKGVSKRYGKAFSVRGAAGASMGLAFPIGEWPTGPYRVEVDLHDRVAEQRILAEGRFTVAED